MGKEFPRNFRSCPSIASQGWILSLAGLLLLAVALWDLKAPPVWWDEGWTLWVARNWVEKGHYGRYLAGAPAPPGLEAAFPVTGLVGLSFHLFGVGIAQGRLVGVLALAGALGFMYFLARCLYRPSIAMATLAVLIGMIPHPFIHPLAMGRQALAEMPMMFYLLAGYAFFLLAMRKSTGFLLLAMIFWGITLQTKAQVLPFLFLSLLSGLLWEISHRKGRRIALYGAALLGSYASIHWFPWLKQALFPDLPHPAEPVKGLYEVTALVTGEMNRRFALELSLKYGLPMALGLVWTAVTFFRQERKGLFLRDLASLRLALLVLSGSWFAWYLLLSVGWIRYLFPAAFVGSLFGAVLLHDWMGHFDWGAMKENFSEFPRLGKLRRATALSLLAFILVVIHLPRTGYALYRHFSEIPGRATEALHETVHFLNTQTPFQALIETYESEIMFLLDRPVHYPPDQVHVELNRRTFLAQNVTIAYDPLAANPDYLVIGSQASLWRLYGPVLMKGAFRPWRNFGYYQVWERIR
jgi:hypothetical protein